MNARKKRLIISSCLLAVFATVGGLILLRESATLETGRDEVSSSMRPAVMSSQLPAQAKDALPAAVAKGLPAPEPEKDEVQIPEGIRYQMADIAEAYRKNMRFPKYSKPLHENDWNLLNPRAFISRDAPLKNKEGLSARMILDRYIVDQNKDLPVTVVISGQSDGFFATVVDLSLSDKEVTRTLTGLDETDGNETTSVYTGTVPADKLSGAGPGEVRLFAEISFANGERARAAAVVKLYENTATLTSLGKPYIDGADLVIPVCMNVEKPGRYRFRANLFDESGARPISHLNSVFPLTRENNRGLLRVHAATLRSQGDPGPYVLKDFDITIPSPKPGVRTAYASSAKESFTVQGFDLSFYSEEEYVDPKNQQRLEFLQKMAAGG
jgi:hypothetical protein